MFSKNNCMKTKQLLHTHTYIYTWVPPEGHPVSPNTTKHMKTISLNFSLTTSIKHMKIISFNFSLLTTRQGQNPPTN